MRFGVNAFKTLAPIFLFSSFLFSLSSLQQSYQVELLEKAENIRLWEDEYWLKLLYYEKSFFYSGYKSQNINPNFFLSKYGKYSPRSEMINHIIGFFYGGEDDKSPECSFPLRYKWLRKKLSVKEDIVPLRRCLEYDEWKTVLNPQKISMVFASGYLSNPSTLYGHTFLILRNPNNSNSLLLDYTVNYAATTGDDKGLGYALKGVFGKYPGNFTTMPYYLKIQEYQNMENRDIWEYPLNLSEDEIDRFLMHSWELGKASFPYYFFSKNCSWQLLPLFEIVRPGSDLKSRFLFWNIPSDTLKAIVEEFGERNNFIYRPSAYSKLKSKIYELNSEEQDYSLGIAKNSEKLKLLDPLDNDKKIRIMDTAVDYISFTHYSGEITQDEMDKSMDPILLKLNDVDAKGYVFNPEIKTPTPPTGSRNSFLIGAGAGRKNGESFYELRLRPSLCDMNDFNEGYLDNSELVMGDIRLRYFKDFNKVYLREFTAVNVLSLNPVDKWFKKSSWGIRFGYYEYERNKRNENDGFLGVQTSRGFSFEKNIENIRAVFFAMGELNLDYGSVLDENFRYGIGPVLGASMDFKDVKFFSKISYVGFKNDKAILRKNLNISLRLSKNIASVFYYSKKAMEEDFGVNLNIFVFP